MSPRSSSSLDIFSPRLKLVTRMLGLSSTLENVTTLQQQQGQPPSRPQEYTYVVSSEGIEVRQPHIETGANHNDEKSGSKGDSPSSISSSKTDGSEIEVSTESATARTPVVKEADDEQVVPPLSQRRGRRLTGLELAGEGTCYTLNETPAIEETARETHNLPIDSKYSHVKQLGIGGEGVCSLVKRRSDSKLFAVKVVKKPRLVKNKPIEAMVGMLFEQRHPSIIRLHHWTSTLDASLAIYYFEYCEGGDLWELINQYRLRAISIPELFIWHTFLSLAGALEFLHRGFEPKIKDRIGIVHRDVKPENIFLRLPRHQNEYPEIVLADFGMASFEFATYDSSAGTGLWQPPELPRKAPKGDVWSLGAVIYYMIHREVLVLDFPEGIDKIRHNQRLCCAAPDPRLSKKEVPEPYSPELIEMMLIACERDHNKRVNSNRLLMMLKAFEVQYIKPYREVIGGAQFCPLENWALCSPSRNSEVDTNAAQVGSASSAGDGCDQYFQAMQEWSCEKREREDGTDSCGSTARTWETAPE